MFEPEPFLNSTPHRHKVSMDLKDAKATGLLSIYNLELNNAL